MKRIIFLLMTALITNVFCEDGLDIFGYFETQMMGANPSRDYYTVHSNKLRIDISSHLSERVSFAANFDYINYFGKTSWNVLEFLPERITLVISDSLGSFFELPFQDRNFLDNAYIKVSFPLFDLTVGKQQVSLGTGYVWNPTDVFNIKDVLDPTYEQPGHDAIRFDLPILDRMTLTGLVSPGDEWKNFDKMILLKSGIGHFDFTMVGIEKLWTFDDFIYFSQTVEKRKLIGGSFVGELLGMGVWGEFAKNYMEVSKDFYEAVLGFDYTFDFQLYIMVEFYRNTIGKASKDNYTLNGFMRYYLSQQKAVCRDQLYLMLNYPLTALLNVGAMSIVSITDKSIAIVPTFNYSLSDNLELMGYFNVNTGEEGTVFSKEQGTGFLIRLRYYF